MPRSIPARERSAPPSFTQGAGTAVASSNSSSQLTVAPELAQWWELAEDLLCVLDLQPRITRVNPACERLLGWTPADLAGEDPLRLLHPNDEQTIRAFLRETRAGTFRDLKARWRHADGSWRCLLWSGVRVADGWQCIGKDITDLQGGEASTPRREQPLDGLLSAMPDGLAVLEEDHTLVWVSKVLLEMTGFSSEELLGSSPPFPFW